MFSNSKDQAPTDVYSQSRPHGCSYAADADPGAPAGENNDDGQGSHGVEGAAGTPAAKPNIDPNPASPAGKGGEGQPSAEEQTEWEFDGQKVKYTRQQIIDELRKAKDYTQKTQELAKTRKEQLARLTRLEQMEAEWREKHPEAAGEGEGGEGDGADDIKTLKNDLAALHQKELQRDWKDSYTPVAKQYPNMDESRLIDRILERKKLGEPVEDAAALMKLAGEVSAEIKSETDTEENKRIEKLLANPEDPRLVAFKQKVISDFVAEKIKHSKAGGDGKGGAGPGANGGEEKKGDLSETAKAIRDTIKS